VAARRPVARSAGAGRTARRGAGTGGDGPSAAAVGRRRRGAARRPRPGARGRPARRHHDVGAVELPAREPPALPPAFGRRGNPPDGGVGVSGGGRGRAGDTDLRRSPSLWPQHRRPGAVRPFGPAGRRYRPLLVARPPPGLASRLLAIQMAQGRRVPEPRLNRSLVRLNYFDLKKSEGWSWAAVLAAFPGPVGAGQLARALILTRLWVNTPCPHQMEAPWRPSSRVRSHPYRRLR